MKNFIKNKIILAFGMLYVSLLYAKLRMSPQNLLHLHIYKIMTSTSVLDLKISTVFMSCKV